MQKDKRDSRRLRYHIGLTDGRAGHGVPSPERRKARRGLVSIHQVPKASPVGLPLILTPTTGSTSKHENGHYTPSHCYSKIRNFILSFACLGRCFHLFIITRELRALPRNNAEVSLHKSTDNYFLTQWALSTKPEVEKILARYPITQKRTRHNVLVQLVGHLINKFGREAAQRIVEEHFCRNRENIRSTLDEHLFEFAAAWDGMHDLVVKSFSPAEQRAFNSLGTGPRSKHQREAFLIVRAFAGVAEHKKEKDFPVSRASLADRLSLTPPGAAGVIRKLCELKIIDRTQCPVTHKESARYCWLLPRGKASQCNQLTHAPATTPPEASPLMIC